MYTSVQLLIISKQGQSTKYVVYLFNYNYLKHFLGMALKLQKLS